MIFCEVITQNKLRIVTVTEKETFCNWLDFVIVKLKSVFVGELYNSVFKASNWFKKLIRKLQMKSYSAIFELVEWWVIAFVDVGKLSLKPIKFVFILWLRIQQLLEFSINFWQVCRSSLDVLLCFEQKYFLLFIVRLYSFC